MIALILGIAFQLTYRAGVRDGYGRAREPSNPDFHKAGEVLEKYESGRFPECKKVEQQKDYREARHHCSHCGVSDAGMEDHAEVSWGNGTGYLCGPCHKLYLNGQGLTATYEQPKKGA